MSNRKETKDKRIKWLLIGLLFGVLVAYSWSLPFERVLTAVILVLVINIGIDIFKK